VIVIPAIDLRGGRVVRLFRGDFGHETAYADEPVEVARRFEAERDGQEHRNGCDRTDARQHADQRAKEGADKTQRNVLHGQGNREAVPQMRDQFLHRLRNGSRCRE